MPRKWSNKDERQYEHILESNRERGLSSDRSKEIAARTVNKTRREEGRTPSKRTQGTSNPNTDLKSRSPPLLRKEELYNRAKQLHIAGRSRMTKRELAEAIRHRG